MGPYAFGNSMMVGFFAFAAIFSFREWWLSRQKATDALSQTNPQRKRGIGSAFAYASSWYDTDNHAPNRVLLVFAGHCALCAALTACMVGMATATTIGQAQMALDGRTIFGTLCIATTAWLQSQFAGMRARRFVIFVTVVFVSLAAIHALVTPISADIIAIEHLRFPWGEETAVFRRNMTGWWGTPIYAIALAVQLFGILAGWRLVTRDRSSGVLVILGAGGGLFAWTIAVLVDLFEWNLPYVGHLPHASFVAVIALLLTRNHRQRTEELAANQQRFRAVFDQTFQFMSLLSVDGKLVETNHTALRFIAVDAQHVAGKPFWETPWWLHSRVQQAHLREAIGAAASGKIVRFEASHARTDGSLAYFDYSLKPVYNDRGNVTLLISEGREVTERKEAERARRMSEATLRSVLETAPDFILTVDRQGTIRFLNRAVPPQTIADVIGQNVFDSVAEEYHAPMRAAIDNVVRTRRTSEIEVIAEIGAARNMCHLFARLGPVIRNDEVVALTVCATDITASKKTEEALRDSHQFNKQIIHGVQNGLVVLDRALSCQVWNPKMEELTCVPATRVVGRKPVEIFPFLAGIGLQDALQRALTGETTTSADFSYELPSTRRQIWNLCCIGPLRNSNDEIVGILISVIDITERKSAEATIERQRARLAGIVNSAMDGIITVDESDRIVLFNTAAEKMFGYAAVEVVGQPIARLIPDRLRGAESDVGGTRSVAKFAPGQFGPIIGKRADGTAFPIEASVAPITLEGRQLDTITCRDVSERVEAETTRRTLEAKLLQSQKMEAIGLLAGGVAHDFNNLLTVIGGYTESLLAELPVNHAFAEPLHAIQHAGDCAASLTRQLLVFSRQNFFNPQVLDINALVKQTEKMLRRLIGEDICFTVRTNPAVGSVKADPAQLNQVLVNLAVNARDAMPKGGSLTIQIDSVDRRDLMPRLPVAAATHRYVKLSISDTGVGIPPTLLTRIFEPFFTTKSVGKGTGLGLAVVHGIVEQCGGHIEVFSPPGAGTTFNLFLPERSEPPAAPVKRLDHRGAVRGSETILLVEDEDILRRLAFTVLESHGYRVLQAADGREALAVADAYRHTIDMVLTDVVMPNMNGFDVAEALRTRFPNIKVLFMSGYSGDAISQRGFVHAELQLLQKPYSTGALVGKVREILDSGHDGPKSPAQLSATV